MKNIKDITISIFAIIGFVAILTSFNNQSQPQITYGTPESHVWEIIPLPKTMNKAINDKINTGAMALNKATGEVRKYSGWNVTINKNLKIANREVNKYVVMIEAK